MKEYYGFAPSTFSVNAAMLKAWMKSPEAPLEQLLKQIAEPYGGQAAPGMIQAWEYVAQHVEAYPWDVTYLIGPMGLDRHWSGNHDWEAVRIPCATWDTPIWKANRRANFMLTEEPIGHPWMFEDAGLRLEDSAALGFKAVEFYDKALAAGGPKPNDIRTQREIVWKTSRALRGKSLHFLLTLAAQNARMAQEDDKRFTAALGRIEILLKTDLRNQAGSPEVAQKLDLLLTDPKKWLAENFNPDRKPDPNEKLPGHETRTVIDWSKWVPARD